MEKNAHAYLSIEEIISMPALSGTTISEDGTKVAFVKKSANWMDNTYRNNVWIHEKNKGESFMLATGEAESSSPLWSPDSSMIAYLSPAGKEGDKKNQIFVKRLDGQNSIQITNEKEEISSFQWDSAGKGIYFITQSQESEEIRKRKETYGDFQQIGKGYRNNCLCFIEIEQKHVHQLTDGSRFHMKDFALSNDGGKIVLVTAPSPDAKDDHNRELYILDVQSGELQNIIINRIVGNSVCFSPDGNQICYTASLREKSYYNNHIEDSTLEIYDLNSGKVTHPLPDFDRIATPLRWTAKGILIQWQDKTNYLIGMLTQDGLFEKVLEESDGFVLEASMTLDGTHISYNKALANETFEIYLNTKKITNENHILNGKLRSNREIISWKNSEGTEIEGVLSTPATVAPGRKYPLLLIIHGGPAWASFPIFSDCFNEKYPIESFIEKGFIVLEPNYKGSSGYGNEFLKANYRKLGTGDYDDIISGVEKLVGQGIADNDKVGIMGWSNGGYISAFCSTFSSRFKAISVGGGITNWSSHYANTDIPYSSKMYLGNTPWNDPEIYAEASPMTYINSACTPTLIQHGEKDARIPVANAYELYRGLLDNDVETELILFKGMAYSPDQPGMEMAIMKQNLKWFSHHILTESIEDCKLI